MNKVKMTEKQLRIELSDYLTEALFTNGSGDHNMIDDLVKIFNKYK